MPCYCSFAGFSPALFVPWPFIGYLQSRPRMNHTLSYNHGYNFRVNKQEKERKEKKKIESHSYQSLPLYCIFSCFLYYYRFSRAQGLRNSNLQLAPVILLSASVTFTHSLRLHTYRGVRHNSLTHLKKMFVNLFC